MSKTENQFTVQEAAVKYHISPGNEFQTAYRARSGINVSAFFDLISISGLSNDELASILDLSFKTIQRYQKENKTLSAMNSEQILKLIALYQKADDVFGNIESFNRWLRKPSAGLDNEHPFSFLQTSGGIDIVHEELIKIEYGALA